MVFVAASSDSPGIDRVEAFMRLEERHFKMGSGLPADEPRGDAVGDLSEVLRNPPWNVTGGPEVTQDGRR